MTDIVSNATSIQNLYDRIGYYKGSPTRIAQATYDFLDDVMKGNVDLVDPTNPFIMLLETSAAQTALAINESLINLRKTYVALAQTNDDIYRHMTDSEYLGRFATPGDTKFTFIMELNALVNALVWNATENCYKGIIPRDTYHTVDTYTFTYEYPVVIRRYNNGVIQITYDVSITSPISSPANNIIDFTIRQDAQGVKWIHFTLPIKQMEITTTFQAIQKNAVFNKNFPIDDQFLYARVFNKSNDTNNLWQELRTTHSDQIFDITTPTAVLKVTEGNLNVVIPYIYNTLDLVSGQIRVDLYTTKGNVTVNLSSYNLEAFSTKFRAIDNARDINAYTNIWSNVSLIAFSDQILTDGTDGISFDDLRKKVINYATGINQIPITTAQLDTLNDLNGFTIIRNADPMTDRWFLGIKKLPAITVTDPTTQLQTTITKANIGIVRFLSNIQALQSSDNVVDNAIQYERITMLSNTMFQLNNGTTSIVERSVINDIKLGQAASIVSQVNDGHYVYTPYYYVFDLSDDLLDLRPYDLDHPDASNLNFMSQNQTLMLPVNTASYSIGKTDTGYQIVVTTSSTLFYKGLSDAQVGVQLRISNTDGSKIGLFNGVLINTDRQPTDERTYRFELQTNHDLDHNHQLNITNGYSGSTIIPDFFIPLNFKADIIYTTTSIAVGFVPDPTDLLINKNILPAGSVGNTRDQVTINLGVYLEYLWDRTRSYVNGPVYQTSDADVPLLYSRDVYQINPITGSILFFDQTGAPYYVKLHTQGDPVLDGNGDPIYRFRVGDVIYDQYGNPNVISSVGSNNEFDLFVIDGKLQFTTDQIYEDYKNQITNLITQWITEDILDVQARLLERTKIFFYPETTLGLTKIYLENGNQTYIESEQSLEAVVYTDASTANDPDVQSVISTNIIAYLNNQLGNQKFIVSAMEADLRTSLGTNVYGVSLSGVGGTNDFQSITVTDEHNRLCIKKVLALTSNGGITLRDDVTITYRTF